MKGLLRLTVQCLNYNGRRTNGKIWANIIVFTLIAPIFTLISLVPTSLKNNYIIRLKYRLLNDLNYRVGHEHRIRLSRG